MWYENVHNAPMARIFKVHAKILVYLDNFQSHARDFNHCKSATDRKSNSFTDESSSNWQWIINFRPHTKAKQGSFNNKCATWDCTSSESTKHQCCWNIEYLNVHHWSIIKFSNRRWINAKIHEQFVTVHWMSSQHVEDNLAYERRHIERRRLCSAFVGHLTEI